MTYLFARIDGLFKSAPANDSLGKSPVVKQNDSENMPVLDSSPSGEERALSNHDIHQRFLRIVLGLDTDMPTQASQYERQVLDQVPDQLESEDFRHKAVPRLPTVMPQLLQSLRNSKASADELVDIIKKDPVIAGAVLKMVNSTFYNPSHVAIDSFHRAIMILGMNGMRSLLTRSLMQPLIQSKSVYFSESGNTLWKHSTSCALACQIMGKSQGLDSFKSYLSGLTHDIGTITLLTQLSHQYRREFGNKFPPVDSFGMLLEAHAPRLGWQIARDWQLPEEVILALKDQLLPDLKNASALGLVVHNANLLSEAHIMLRQDRLDPAEAQAMLSQFQAPANLFEQLD